MMDEHDGLLGDRNDWVGICEAVLAEDAAEHVGSMLAEPEAVYSSSPLYRDNLLLKETFDLSVRAIRFVDRLGCTRGWSTDQFERSACSSGADSKEAQNAESLKDFIHKLKIALKEADEAEYWYCVIAATQAKGVDADVIARIQRVIRILNKIISTSKQRLQERKRTASPGNPSANRSIS